MGRLRLMKRLCALVVPVLVLMIAGCGGSSKSSSSSSTQAPATSQPSGGAAPSAGPTQVSIKSLAFNPSTIHAKVGDTIEWTNNDGPPHNVTWTSGPKFISSHQLNTHDTFSLKLTQAGTIHYICSIHPFMKATIVVTK